MRTDKEYWDDTISRYRASKLIRNIRRNHNLGLSDIAKKTGKTRQFIYNVQEINFKPSKEFLDILQKIGGE